MFPDASIKIRGRSCKTSAVRVGGLSSADTLQTREERALQMRASKLFIAKNSDFSKIMV